MASNQLPKKVSWAAVEITTKKGVRLSKTHGRIYVFRPMASQDEELQAEGKEFFQAHGIEVR